jgi:hypothetical protein
MERPFGEYQESLSGALPVRYFLELDVAFTGA